MQPVNLAANATAALTVSGGGNSQLDLLTAPAGTTMNLFAWEADTTGQVEPAFVNNRVFVAGQGIDPAATINLTGLDPILNSETDTLGVFVGTGGAFTPGGAATLLSLGTSTVGTLQVKQAITGGATFRAFHFADFSIGIPETTATAALNAAGAQLAAGSDDDAPDVDGAWTAQGSSNQSGPTEGGGAGYSATISAFNSGDPIKGSVLWDVSGTRQLRGGRRDHVQPELATTPGLRHHRPGHLPHHRTAPGF